MLSVVPVTEVSAASKSGGNLPTESGPNWDDTTNGDDVDGTGNQSDTSGKKQSIRHQL